MSLRTLLSLDRVLLRSRFGRRLLLIFLGCALLPTLTVGLFSFLSVRAQLSEQADDRLQELVLTAGQALRDRVALLEGDLRMTAGGLQSCVLESRDPRECLEGAMHDLPSVAMVGDGFVVPISGSEDADLIRRAVQASGVRPGMSDLVPLDPAGRAEFIMVHRAASDPSIYTVGVVDSRYIWGDGLGVRLPEAAHLTLWDPEQGQRFEERAESPVITARVRDQMARSATGAFRWIGTEESYRAAYWSFPSTRRLHLPAWRLVLSQPEAAVYGPMQDFTRTFPVLVLALLLGVLVFGLSRIRRRVIPLEALHEGTRRLARQDFAARVEIASGDEIEELASSFNAMAATVDKQFNALRTAAEIDRAVLSRMDRTEIVETALNRLPELVACEGVTLTLLDPANDGGAVVWVADAQGKMQSAAEPLRLDSSEIDLIRTYCDRLVFKGNHPGLPVFAESLRCRDRGHRIEVYPLRFGEDLCGALALRRAIPLGESDVEAVQIRRLTDQIAVALGNARMVERVRFLAFYDSLTGLPNRVLYKERLDQALLRAERRRLHVALCFLDLDQFSTINDSLGHDLGDDLIEQVAGRLLTVCRESDIVARLGNDLGGVEVARLGGDEFTVVLPDLVDPQDASRIARRLLASFREPFRLGTHEVFMSTSIGLAVYPEDGRDIETLLKNADVAMYHAKEQGRNTYRMYSASMNAEAVERLQLEQQLRRAVEGGEFSLVYQPIVDVASGRIAGAEALVRWNHPERGIVSPGEFISLSEESGLIVRLGEWILKTVCEQAVAWQAAGHGPIYAAVNLSARQLQHEDFVGSVRDILAETGVDPRLLVLELTESVLMQPEGHVANSIRALAHLGLRFAIDDFGTGYSSLSYLKHFPVGALKIDRTFVENLPGNSDDGAIASAIVALGRALDLEIVAEGVETMEQARFLAGIGCDKIQGFLMGQPLMPAQFLALRAGGPLPLAQMLRDVAPSRGLGEPQVAPRPYEAIIPQTRIGMPDPVDLA